MKRAVLSISFAALVFTSFCTGIFAREQQKSFDGLYNQWHEALNSNAALGEPFWTRLGPIEEMKEAGIAFGIYLCEKVADESNAGFHLYQDVHLLNQFAGVNLYYPKEKLSVDTNIFSDLMPKLVAQFRQEWSEGLYKDPSKIVAQICEQRMSKEGGSIIVPGDVVGLRRYGIFGLPELIRQIKKNNSKHAFAAYLIITGASSTYSDYIQSSNILFSTKEKKLEHVSRYVEEIKSYNSNQEWMRRIASALAK